MWNKLSMAERANIIALGVRSGITNLDDIRKGYNSFARGGYTKWKQSIKEHKGIDIDNDPTYDYEGFYNSDPDRAWDMMNKDSDAHFIDEYKTALYPSFSNQSIYSGHKNRFNPRGITGGTWIDDNNYQLSQSQLDNEWDTDSTLDYFNWAESSPVNLYAPDGSTMLRSVTVTPNIRPRREKTFGKGGGMNSKKYTPATLAGWATQVFTGDDSKAAYADISSSVFNTGVDAIPVVGNMAGAIVSAGDALYDGAKLIVNPSWSNTIDFGTSLLGIIPGVGSAKDVKNIAKATKQTYKNVKTTKSTKAVGKTVTRKPNAANDNVRVNVLRPDMRVKSSYPLQLPTHPYSKLTGTIGNWSDTMEDTGTALNYFYMNKK